VHFYRHSPNYFAIFFFTMPTYSATRFSAMYVRSYKPVLAFSSSAIYWRSF
jgi:hypothetical protein